MDRAEANPAILTVPAVPMKGIWQTIRSYILWSHERGTIQYDVMVTLILLFVLFSPKVINFKDKPVDHYPQSAGAVVLPDGHGGFIYEVAGSAVTAKDDATVRSQLLQIIEPISGGVNITKIEPVRDRSGHVLHYKVWVERE